MDEISNHNRAVELLQELGLKEYEARSFVALSRLPQGTAKEISDISDVPRTRVYDAVRVLETKGLVEIQHSSPKQFRAVAIEEATERLQYEYEARTASLRKALKNVEPALTDERTEATHEVWALSEKQAIANRTRQLVGEADEEVVIVVGHGTIFTDALADSLQTALQRGVTVVVGTADEELRDQIEETLPDAEVFVSGLEWLVDATEPTDQTEISRLLLVDQTTLLVSTLSDSSDEKAVFGRGFDNGLVTIARRLMTSGLLSILDPGSDDS